MHVAAAVSPVDAAADCDGCERGEESAACVSPVPCSSSDIADSAASHRVLSVKFDARVETLLLLRERLVFGCENVRNFPVDVNYNATCSIMTLHVAPEMHAVYA